MIQKTNYIESPSAKAEFSALYKEILKKSNLTDDRYRKDCIISAFYSLTQHMNESPINITAITSTWEIICRHYADSLSAEAFIPYGSSVIDVGTGGGFPALPLAIVRPDIKITALDSTAKKIKYVENTANKLNLENLYSLCGRAEELCEICEIKSQIAKSNKNNCKSSQRAQAPIDQKNSEPFFRETFDVAISRAVAPLPVLCELCLPFVRVGGLFVALKGSSANEELERSKHAVKILGGEMTENKTIRLQAEKELLEHHVLIFQKKSKTPIIYPRKFAKINKNPL